MEPKDLFPTDQQRKKSEGQRRCIVAQYDYPNENGQLLFQVVRYKPKGFSQRRPDGRGGWIRNLRGIRRVLYRLPQLLNADPATWVFVVEGEKDADRLAALGLVATTNPQGAAKWRDEYSAFLRKRRVAVMPDNDDAGEKHADDVVRSLLGVAAEVKMIRLPELPPNGDVSDWLDQGGTVEQLMDLVKRTVGPPEAGAFTQGIHGYQGPQGFQDSQRVDVRVDMVKAKGGRLNDREPLSELVGRVCLELRDRPSLGAGGASPVFLLARAVKGHPSMNGVRAIDALRQIQAILEAMPRLDEGTDAWRHSLGVPQEDGRTAFQDAYDQAYSKPGEPLLELVIAEAKANPLPFTTDRDSPAYIVFLTAVARLQRDRGRSPVRVSVRAYENAGIGASWSSVATYCKWGVTDGYMEKVSNWKYSPNDKKCSEYRFNLDRVPVTVETGTK